MHAFIRSLIAVFLTASIPVWAIAANERLVFALDLIRHGDRTPFVTLPNAPHTWSEGDGQLTALGMQQEYQLGIKLHQRYIIDNHLLPANYQANTIYVRSTEVDRTMMSAQSLLIGLYSPGTGPVLADATPALPAQIQPIPIHVIPAAQDNALLIDLRTNEFSELLTNHVFTRADWQRKSAEWSPQYARWSQLTGATIDNMVDVISVGDTLNTYLAHDIALPDGLSREEAKTIIAAGNWILATLFKPQQVGDIAGKGALNEIKEHLQRVADQNAKTKFVLLSAHDVTLLGVMSALHVPLDSAPPYASDLNFSVYQSDSDELLIKVTLNNKPVLLPGCTINHCSLNQWLKQV
ncbi:histidine phosphatase family protein [Legionella brunensis]|uniref:Major acid phosphatase Map (Histidine-acid phosphatase) n=1 Tax=Legionella brunensis TaxID=29422 RepID=A0A0W0SU10_9GAMM|nr:histidine phosphatase family protein [Legionella brunensis]KTC86846.1 major acid phosphatase Map (histidine-acid phosphatase) [Legionella brunensis]